MSDIQTVFINGGTTFRSREDNLAFLQNKEVSLQDEETWYNTDYLENKLACEVIKLKMPCRSNARYKEWKITFDKYLQHLSDTIILIGLSLGGTFLAKYLSENTVAKQIQAAYLIGAPYDNDLIEKN